jgi:hypothetical protein
MENSLIKELGLNYSQVRSIVENWYINELPDNFQSESGLDLEEIVTDDYQLDYYEGNAIEDLKLDNITILSIVHEWYTIHYLQDQQYDGNGVIYSDDDVELDEFCVKHIFNIIESN